MRRVTLFGLLAAAILLHLQPASARDHLPAEALQALAEDPPNQARIEKLRHGGPPALEALFKLREQLQNCPPTDRLGNVSQQDAAALAKKIARLDDIIDQVGQQRYCSRSRLYWYTDFEQARSAARASGKPILSLRMLGKLDEDFSCANSRFFRTTLYANEEISNLLRENYVLHWKSVRPVPKVTIDFGDGRKLERTITGNSIHYVLTPDGDLVEALPGLYGPRAFLAKTSSALAVAKNAAAVSPGERQALLAAYHQRELQRIGEQFAGDLRRVAAGPLSRALARPIDRENPPPANVAAAAARPKVAIERPLLAAALPLAGDPMKLEDDSVWTAIAALHAEESKIDDSSRELIRSENPHAAIAGRLAITKRRVEDPLVRLVQSLESSIALDSVKNEYRFHRQIHEWLAAADYRPDVDTLNERVYAELFLTPSSDPWLGLAPAEVYTALPNGGVVAK